MAYNYFDPRAGYGGQRYGYNPGDFATSPVGDTYLENNRDAAFTRFAAERGIVENSPMGRYWSSQQDNLERGYEASLATNPFLKFQSFLRQQEGALRDRQARLTPEERGVNTSLNAPRARKIPW